VAILGWRMHSLLTQAYAPKLKVSKLRDGLRDFGCILEENGAPTQAMPEGLEHRVEVIDELTAARSSGLVMGGEDGRERAKDPSCAEDLVEHFHVDWIPALFKGSEPRPRKPPFVREAPEVGVKVADRPENDEDIVLRLAEIRRGASGDVAPAVGSGMVGTRGL
jgi:hypothetical protein